MFESVFNYCTVLLRFENIAKTIECIGSKKFYTCQCQPRQKQ